MKKKTSRKRRSGWIDFATVKLQVSIEQVLAHYGLLDDLEEKDDGYCGPCPFHEGESPRPFHVSTSKNAWYCHGCEEGGNVLDFAARMEDVSIRKAAGILAEAFGLTDAQKPLKGAPGDRKADVKTQEAVPAEDEALSGPQTADLEEGLGLGTPSEEVSPESSDGNKPLGFALKLDAGHELLRPLGFDRGTIERFEAGYCSRGMMAGRLAVPIHSPTGELLAYAGRGLNGDESYKYPEKFSRELELYNLHRVRQVEHLADIGLLVVPELLDVWRCFEAGHPNAVALMATTMSDHQQALLLSLSSDQESDRVVLLLPPGQERDQVLARLAGELWVRLTSWQAAPHTMQTDELARVLA